MIEDVDHTNLFGVGVRQMPFEHRNDFVKYMWKEKELILHYAYVQFKDDVSVHQKHLESLIDALESEIEATDAIDEYSSNKYPEAEDEIEKNPLLNQFELDVENYYGDSTYLLLLITMMGIEENKQWVYSDKKIAITGSVEDDGKVKKVGMIPLKTLTARKNGADILIVPKSQLNETKDSVRQFFKPIEIVGVETIDETIEWLVEHIN